MRVKIGPFLLAVIYLFVGLAAAADLNAEPPPVPSLSVIETGRSPDAAACGAGAQQLIDVTGQAVGCEFWDPVQGKSRKAVQLGSGGAFEVEPLNATLVSAGGNTLLKFGSFSNVALPAGNPYAWILYSADGKRLAEMPGTLAADAAVAMAGEGHFAIVGGSNLTLYSPSGAEIFSLPLGDNVFATQIALRKGAETIALTLTDSHRYRDGTTDIMLFAKSAERIGVMENVRYPNTLLFAGPAGDQLLAGARGTLMLLDAGNARPLWKTNRYYRLAVPASAGISPDGRYLNLITMELPTDPQRRYLGRAHLLSMADGRHLTSVDLPGIYTTGKMPVNTHFGDHTIELKTPDRDVIRLSID